MSAIGWLAVKEALLCSPRNPYHRHRLSFNREGRWGTTDDFSTSFFHFSLRSSSRSLLVSKPTTISVCGCKIPFSPSARNLGFFITDDMIVELHVKNVSAYSELRIISTRWHLFSVDFTKTLLSAFALSRLDYCNSLLSGCPKHLLEKLQKV